MMRAHCRQPPAPPNGRRRKPPGGVTARNYTWTKTASPLRWSSGCIPRGLFESCEWNGPVQSLVEAGDRFCRSAPPLAWRSKGNPGGFQVRGRRFPPYTGGSLDAPERPSQSPQRDDLLFVLFAQDVTHIVGGYRPHARVIVQI